MRFVYPQAFWLLALLPLLWALEWRWLSRRRAQAELFAPGEFGARWLPARDRGRARLKLILVSLGLAAIVVGLARPQSPGPAETPGRADRAHLMLAVDCSLSMLARDLPPDRLSAAKRQLGAFIARRPGDRIGLIAFAGEARVVCPATVDHDALKLALSRVRAGSLAGGSDPAAAVALAVRKLEALGNSGGAVVLVTDGEDTRGGDVGAAAAAARARGIRVFTLGAGTPAGAHIPLGRDFWGRERIRIHRGRAVVTRLVSLPLRKAAQFGGGGYRALERPETGAALAADCDRARVGGSRTARPGAPREAYPLAVAAALLCLAAAGLISDRRTAS